MGVLDYLGVLWRRRVLLVVSTLVGLLLGGFVTIMATPVYAASAQIFVTFNSDEGAGSNELVQGMTYAQRALGSYAKVGKTSVVLDQVSKQLGEDGANVDLMQAVSVGTVPDTTILQISVQHQNADLTAEIANTVASVLRDTVINNLESSDANDRARVRMEIVQPATVPSSPVAPSPARNVAFGGFAGLLVGVLVSIALGFFDQRIQTRVEVAQVTDLPLLGEIPDDPKAKTEPLLRGDEVMSLRAEPFRALRTNLQFLGVGQQVRCLMVTSSMPGEGKSTVSVNLAVMLAEAGLRVVLVDTDLRRPKLAEYVGLDGSVGLTDVLIGKTSVEDAVQRWGRHQLYVLPAGQIPPNPSELLGSSQMKDLTRVLSTHFDYVIIDSPPVLLVTDPAVVSHMCDGVVVVASSGLTKKPQLKGTLDTLAAVEAPVKGLVLTRVPTKGPGSYHYGAYSYGGYRDENTVAAPMPHTTAAPNLRDIFPPISQPPHGKASE
ncbi:polysaccharide biosynthesis tyrosine autokinase [Scrofimicrobium sp. R131]|uniref:non-specific protein-tyrosine kinase n=1 Tax=Scrofimicrobium appendicitidis TaxID=3079930 RepID=A0AAU7VB04_9ACTO